LVYRNGTVDIQVDLHQETQISAHSALSSLVVLEAHSAEAGFIDPSFVDPSSVKSPGPEHTLKYKYIKDVESIKITPELPYLSKIYKGDPVEGFNWIYEPFEWQFPSLAIKVVNNTKQTLLLSEVVFRVHQSKKDERSILVINPGSSGKAVAVNEGWGPVESPSLRVSIKHPDACSSFSLDSPKRIPLQRFDRSTSFSIREFVPESLIDEVTKCTTKISAVCYGGPCVGSSGLDLLKCLEGHGYICDRLEKQPSQIAQSSVPVFYRNALAQLLEIERRALADDRKISYNRECSVAPICVHGQLDYRDNEGRAEVFKFASKVRLGGPPLLGPVLPSYTYEVFLEGGKSNYVQRKSISQEIKPGDVDHFLIKVATDRSASFDFNMEIVAAGGSIVWMGKFDMALLVPRSGAQFYHLSPVAKQPSQPR
jgi:hypothetical protein